MIEIMDIEELINGMSIRPQMFVLPVKIESIYNFVGGFLVGVRNQEVSNNSWFESINSMFFLYFGKWVFQWIKSNIDKKYKFESFAWYEMIQSVTKDENEAIELFFSLCKEFFKCYNEKDDKYWEKI